MVSSLSKVYCVTSKIAFRLSLVKPKSMKTKRPLRQKENTSRARWEIISIMSKLSAAWENTSVQVEFNFVLRPDWLRKFDTLSPSGKNITQTCEIPDCFRTVENCPFNHFRVSSKTLIIFYSIFLNCEWFSIYLFTSSGGFCVGLVENNRKRLPSVQSTL